MRRRPNSGLLFAALFALCACGGEEKEERVVHVYNWTDYIGSSTIADFEARTGIRVIYDTYDSNEVLETKMLTGRSGYDVVFPSAVPLQRQLKAGVFRELDRSKLPNFANLDAEVMRRIAINDPGNRYAIPYMWGTAGIGYNPRRVEQVLGTDRIDSWSAVFDPAVASRLAKCGIAYLDSPEDIVMLARIYLGLDPNSESREDLAAAERLLKSVRPHIRYFSTTQLIGDLASGEICAVVSWNGYVLQARDRGAATEPPVGIEYVVPREGTFIWFDTVAIPADAPHVDNAHAFLNFLMEPGVIARISNEIGYANGNSASLPFLDERVRNDGSVYPPGDVWKRLHSDTVESPEYMRDVTRAWMRLKTGQ